MPAEQRSRLHGILSVLEKSAKARAVRGSKLTSRDKKRAASPTRYWGTDLYRSKQGYVCAEYHDLPGGPFLALAGSASVANELVRRQVTEDDGSAGEFGKAVAAFEKLSKRELTGWAKPEMEDDQLVRVCWTWLGEPVSAKKRVDIVKDAIGELQRDFTQDLGSKSS